LKREKPSDFCAIGHTTVSYLFSNFESMKYNIVRYWIIALLFIAFIARAQQNPRVVLHLQSADSLVHKSVVNQIANIKKELPNAEVHLICHGPGLEFLLVKKSTYAARVQKLALSGVQLVGCEFTMSQRNYKRSDLVDFASTVPSGIVEILKKEQAGWLYVKLGF
jgi:uncharacterized protein